MVTFLSKNRSIAFILTIAVLFIGVQLWLSSSKAKAANLSLATPSDIKTALYRGGLDPTALAACGVNSESVSGVVTGVETYFSNNPTALATADENYSSAKVSYEALSRKVANGNASAQDISNLATATTTLATEATARANVMNAIITAATANLNNGQKLLLTKLAANRSWALDTHFSVVDRTQAQWVALRDAVATKKINEKYNEQIDSAAATLINTELANETVALSKTNSTNTLAGVTSAFDSELNN
ncbi:MAG: hypothetical protein ACKVS6_15620 [Planctomycetota bacterium]